MSHVREEIRNFIINKINQKSRQLDIALEEDIGAAFSLTGSGLFDSMDFMDLLAEIETTFRAEVDFSDYEPEVFTTVDGFVACVRVDED